MNIVLSGPSGSGKGTITNVLMKEKGFKKFTTCTTRNQREGEVEGFDYYFISKEKFLEYMNNGLMNNIREYGGKYYGSFEKDIDNIETNIPIIFQLTPDRALEMKKANPNTLLILVLPPNVEELSNRRRNRSNQRIQDDITNLHDAIEYDYVLINDDLEVSVNELMDIIKQFNSNSFLKDSERVKAIISKFINQFNDFTYSSKIESVFNKEIAGSWDQKSRFVTYHGNKNPLSDEVMAGVRNGMSIADIGCGTGKLISKIDQTIDNSYLVGLDISDDMIENAQKRDFSGNNQTFFINDDFMKHKFNSKFDMIIFAYVLHHMKNPAAALRKAKDLLTDEGRILFSIPGSNYLQETFTNNELTDRYTIDSMDDIVRRAGLFPLSACRNNFLMTFNSYEMYIDYLKSIGTYQKINGYTNNEWDEAFNKEILKRFNESEYITGEYLTYNCGEKKKILRR